MPPWACCFFCDAHICIHANQIKTHTTTSKEHVYAHPRSYPTRAHNVIFGSKPAGLPTSQRYTSKKIMWPAWSIMVRFCAAWEKWTPPLQTLSALFARIRRSLSLSLSLFHTHTHTHTHKLSLSHTHTLSLSLCLYVCICVFRSFCIRVRS
jgi:hypothetical protein